MKAKLTSVCSILVCVLAFVSPARGEGKNIAILIGINKYSGGLPPLEYCIADVKLMYDKLINQCGYDERNVLLMHDELPVSERLRLPYRYNLKRQIRLQLELAGANDTVLFFFSGHGILREDKSYLATLDCDLADLAETALSAQELRDWLNDPNVCKAKRKFLILDCCHAGGGGAKDAVGAEPLGDDFGDRLEGEEAERIQKQNEAELLRKSKEDLFQSSSGLVTLGSCTKNEKSWEWKEKGLGLFTYYLAEGLSGKADYDRDGFVDHLELHKYAYEQVRLQAAKEYGEPQTPVLYHDPNYFGVFKLAKVAVPQPVAPDRLVEKFTLPQPPRAEAKQAYQRLTAAKDGNLSDRLKDAKLLVEEARRLRVPILNSAAGKQQLVQFDNPFFDPGRALDVYNWLSSARKEFVAQGEKTPASLDVSLSLAAWFKQQPDRELANELVNHDLHWQYPFDRSEDTDHVATQLLLLHAALQKDDPDGRRAALNSYTRVLDLVARDNQIKQLAFDELDQHVFEPALAVTAKVGAENNASLDPDTRRQLATVYGAHGDAIERYDWLPGNRDAIASFEKAVQFLPDSPPYRIGLARVLAKEPNPDFAKIHEQVEKVLGALGGTARLPELAAAANRLAGDVWLQESRSAQQHDDRMVKLRAAEEAYNTAIRTFADLPAAGAVLSGRGQRDLALCYLGRSVTYVYRANLDVKASQQRDEVLAKAQQDAEMAAQLDSDQGYWAYMALGNSFEDQAWLTKRTDLWEQAVAAFGKAVELRRDRPECFIYLGRCNLKRGSVETAVEHLQYSLKLGERPEAYYWLCKVYEKSGNYQQADESLTKAVELIKGSGKDNSDYDRGQYLAAWSELPLNHAKDLIDQRQKSDAQNRTPSSLLATSRARIDDVRPFDADIAGLLLARASDEEARWMMLTGQPSRDVEAKVREAAGLYESLLRAKNLMPGTRVAALCRVVELYCQTSLGQADAKTAQPIMLARAEEAVKLATELLDNATRQQPLDVAERRDELSVALGLAGMAHSRYAAARVADNKQLADAHFEKAKVYFRSALAQTAEHPRSWHWSYALGQVLHREASFLKLQPDLQARYQEAKEEGVERYAFAHKTCPTAVEKEQIRQKWSELYRF